MRVNSVKIVREAKISVAQYENTLVRIELEAQVDYGNGETIESVSQALTTKCDVYLRDKIDEIELGKRKVQSKANRFGC